MDTQQILEDFGGLLSGASAPEAREAFGDTLAMVIRGQMTSLLLAATVQDEPSRKHAMLLFQFFTTQAYAFSMLSSSVNAFGKAMSDTAGTPVVFEVKDGNEFESDHRKLRESGELMEFQHKISDEVNVVMNQKIKDHAGELLGKMMNLVAPVEFAETIDG